MDQLPSGEWWPDRDRLEQVAVISDESGWCWEVVVDGGRVTALTVRPPEGERVSPRALTGAPLGWLRDAAASYWREVDAAMAERGDAINVSSASDAIVSVGGAIEPSVGRPTPEDFASAWKATPVRHLRDGNWVTRREALRRRYRRPNGSAVALATIDKWTREARDLGLIEPARTGKPRVSSSTDSPSD